MRIAFSTENDRKKVMRITFFSENDRKKVMRIAFFSENDCKKVMRITFFSENDCKKVIRIAFSTENDCKKVMRIAFSTENDCKKVMRITIFSENDCKKVMRIMFFGSDFVNVLDEVVGRKERRGHGVAPVAPCIEALALTAQARLQCLSKHLEINRFRKHSRRVPPMWTTWIYFLLNQINLGRPVFRMPFRMCPFSLLICGRYTNIHLIINEFYLELAFTNKVQM